MSSLEPGLQIKGRGERPQGVPMLGGGATTQLQLQGPWGGGGGGGGGGDILSR